MSLKKVSRKGKLDRDLPFRERKTFAIFPRRSVGWRNEDILFAFFPFPTSNESRPLAATEIPSS